MSFCPSGCAVTIPTAPSSGCKVKTRKGGVHRLIFASCDVTWTDVTNLTEWQQKISYDQVHASGVILGSKPKGSFDKKKVASCLPEQVTGGTKSLNFSDFNADDEDFLDYDFWNDIMQNHGNMVMGYVDCDDNFYGWHPEFALEVDDEREEDSNGNTFFSGVITWKSITMTKPVNIPGLNAILE